MPEGIRHAPFPLSIGTVFERDDHATPKATESLPRHSMSPFLGQCNDTVLPGKKNDGLQITRLGSRNVGWP